MPTMQNGALPQPSNLALSNVAYIPPGFEEMYKESFIYEITFNPSTHGAGAQSQSTNIQNDSFFVCTEQCAFIVDSATGLTVTAPTAANMLVRLTNISSGKYMMNDTVPIGNFFGTGPQPFVWLYRANVYAPGGQLQVELTNNMAADQTVRLSFVGFKVYNVPDSAKQM